MTIYAIVNDIIGSPPASAPCWTLISQSGILQGGNPYFVPDFAERFEARTALAVRLGKLGKGIATRFVSRYVDAVAPAVLFVAADRLSSLRADGLPWASAISYDRCLAIGRFTSMPYDGIIQSKGTLSLKSVETGISSQYIFGHGCPSLDEVVAAISRDNTLKTGDIILMGISGKGPEATPGLRATLMLNGDETRAFKIR